MHAADFALINSRVVAPAPYVYVPLAGFRAVTVDTGDSRGLVTVNLPTGVYFANNGNMTVRAPKGGTVKAGINSEIVAVYITD